jgi:aurora kinase
MKLLSLDGNLQNLIEKSTSPLSEQQALHLFAQLALGTLALHEKGIAHKDMRPDNIYLDHTGKLKIGGLCRLGKKQKPVTATIPYISPEIHMG